MSTSQATGGDLLPVGSLKPLGPEGPLTLGPDKSSEKAWRQLVYMHEELLRAVHEEKKLRKDWFDQYLAQAKKYSGQMMLIVEKHVAKQETKQAEWLGRVSDQLKEQITSDICKIQLTAKQSSYDAADNGHLNNAPLQIGRSFSDLSPHSITISKNRWAEAAVQTPNIFLQERAQPTYGNGGVTSWKNDDDDQFYEEEKFQTYHVKGSLEEYIRDGPGICTLWHGHTDDWHEYALQRGNIWIDRLHYILYSLGLAHTKKLERPDDNLSTFVRNDYFLGASACLVLINTAFIGIEAHISVTDFLENQSSHVPSFLNAADWFFITIFMVELLLRMLGEKWWFFLGPDREWNMLDMCIAFASLFFKQWEDMAVMNVRAFRTFRSVRVLRVIRVMNLFKDLRMMVLAIGSAMWSLAWAFALLLLTMLAFSITILQSVYYHLRDSPADDEHVEHLDMVYMYGGLPKSMFSLMQAISGGRDWCDLVVPLGHISWWWYVAFSIYIVFIVFGVLNVLTGVFVTTASGIVDRDLIVETEASSARKCMEDMRSLLMELDTHNTGALTWEKFTQCMKHVKVQTYLSAVGIEISDAFTIFRLLAREANGETGVENPVEIRDFILGCVRLRGWATRMNVMVLNRDLERYDEKLRELKRGIGNLHSDVRDILKSFCEADA